MKHEFEVTKCGCNVWRLDGKLHHETFPALVYPDGAKYWYLNGELHRVDGPAVELPDGSYEYHVNGEFHRVDGPAYYCAVTGLNEWYIDGSLVERGYLQM